ncbi:uncharacterized protein [Littorina saxatilis]|uniref:uncharacterized protein n=1 Tax=Littorina saxatilis TaxID=31220 RepID=UPI0038B66E08
MEIDEADAVKVCDNLTVTHMAVTSTDTTLQKGLFTHGKNSNTKGTQTPGHVFFGKLGEVIITSNYNLVKLVINDTALTRLADRNFNIEQLQDTVVTSLARLDWNGERILDKAMTSFRLTLTNEMMPQLLKELTGVMKSEAERHQVQHLVEKLFGNYKVKLFGFDVASFVFILEHCSIDDAEMTSILTEKQAQLQEILTTFLPVWVGQSAVWSASRYTLSSADLSRDFGYRDFSVVSMTATEQTSTSTSTSTSTGDQMDVATKVKYTTSEDEQPMASSVAQQTLSAQTQSLVGATSLDHLTEGLVADPAQGEMHVLVVCVHLFVADLFLCPPHYNANG